MNILRHIRKDFVHQMSENDCGAACLGMILNYIDRSSELPDLLHKVNPNGLSLLDIRNIACEYGISAKCVMLDLNFLREIDRPVILHTNSFSEEGHFQVCYGHILKKGRFYYLMADPAKEVYLLPEDELVGIWVSKSAVYFPDLPNKQNAGSKSGWMDLLSSGYFPRALFIIIPFINLCSMALGIGLSWMLQKGINDSLADKKTSLIIGIILLLSIITIGRSLFNFVKQHLLISINNSINKKLVQRLIINTIAGPNTSIDLIGVKANLNEIQKVQNALSMFLSTLLSDGSLILLLIGVLTYNLPVLILPNGIYLIIIILSTIRNLPEFSFKYAHLNQLSGRTENYLAKQSRSVHNVEYKQDQLRFHKENHKTYLDYAQKIAFSLSKINLFNETLGTLTIMATFCIALTTLQRMEISYTTFMLTVIISYLITSLMPKLANSFFVIAEGVQASSLLSLKMPIEYL